MSNISPVLDFGVTAYYQGRPNTVFLERYKTLEKRTIRTPA